MQNALVRGALDAETEQLGAALAAASLRRQDAEQRRARDLAAQEGQAAAVAESAHACRYYGGQVRS